MAGNRPRGRQRNVTGAGKSISRRGSGVGTGPVGNSGGYSGRGTGGLGSGGGSGRRVGGSGGRMTRSGGGGGLIKIIMIVAVLLLGGGTGVGSLLGGFSGDSGSSDGGYYEQSQYPQGQNPQSQYPQSQYSQSSQGQYGGQGALSGTNLEELLGGLGGGSVSNGWGLSSNTGRLDTTVADGAREKRTQILGDGRDTVTLMVYLCGTDLESRSGMGTSDLQEMLNADISDNVKLLVYTGGCSGWRNNVIDSRTNQIWQVKDDGLLCLEKDLGSVSMTDPDTLSGFIRWCADKYPANRYSLIFWDHGGGSVSGYGYDEKFSSSGSMSLAEINEALTDGGVSFDFVGFDACLMATAENALMLTKHADYLIASEETEPGVGWYYTNWLTELSENPSMPTIQIGRKIIDDFVDMCARKCQGQSTTLSMIDLAELELTVPKAFSEFSSSTSDLIRNQEYRVVSNARSDAREFGASSKIDQVDLVHLAKNMGTKEGDALAEALLGAVKYNRTSSNMTNSYGVSIYFPYKKVSAVDKAVATYEQIGLDEEYVRCIQEFASLEVSGQAVSGGTASPLPTLMGMMGAGGFGSGNSGGGYSGSGYSGTGYPVDSAELIGQLLGSFLGGDVGSIAGLGAGNIGFLGNRALSDEDMAAYLQENRFDGSALVWADATDGAANEGTDGSGGAAGHGAASGGNTSGKVISLPESQWELVQTLHANMFYDDGQGYIDLGLDNVYEFDEMGNLLAPEECTWLAINEQPVAYYHESTTDDGEDYTITGYVPVLHNGVRGEMILAFTDEDPYGSVVGVRTVYTEGETDTIPKTMDPVAEGDTLDFICDYYSYSGEYLDSYLLGEQMIVDGELVISDVYVDADATQLTYRFTDIYNQEYWTEPVELP